MSVTLFFLLILKGHDKVCSSKKYGFIRKYLEEHAKNFRDKN